MKWTGERDFKYQICNRKSLESGIYVPTSRLCGKIKKLIVSKLWTLYGTHTN